MRSWKLQFATFWSAQAFSLFGSSLAQFALIWWLTISTGSAMMLALATLAGMLPALLFGPFIGALVDRNNRRTLIILSDSVSALLAFVLAYLFWSGLIETWHLLVVMFIRSLAGAFQFPAVQASISLMVPQDQLSRVNGWNQMLNGGMQIASPPLGALLIAFMPIEGILLIDVVTALIAVALVQFVHIPRQQRLAGAGGFGSILRDMGEGFRYLWNWPALCMLFACSSMLNLLITPAFSLMPLLITDHFKGDAIQLSWMEMALGVGVVIGGMIMGLWGGFKRRILTSLCGILGMSLGIFMIGLAPADRLWLAVVGMFIVGLMMAWTNGPIFAIIQTVVLPEMQGRVMSVISSVAMAMTPIGLFLAAPIAEHIGIQTTFLIAGVGCLGACCVVGLVKSVRNLEDSAPVREQQSCETQADHSLGVELATVETA